MTGVTVGTGVGPTDARRENGVSAVEIRRRHASSAPARSARSCAAGTWARGAWVEVSEVSEGEV
jgi:hypothetical protein